MFVLFFVCFCFQVLILSFSGVRFGFLFKFLGLFHFFSHLLRTRVTVYALFTWNRLHIDRSGGKFSLKSDCGSTENTYRVYKYALIWKILLCIKASRNFIRNLHAQKMHRWFLCLSQFPALYNCFFSLSHKVCLSNLFVCTNRLFTKMIKDFTLKL